MFSEQVLIGSLLGDGNLRRPTKNRNAVYSEEHCLKQADYLKWKNDFLGFKECLVTRTDVRRKGKKTYQQCCIYSPATPELNVYHTLFYPNGKKTITNTILNKLDLLGIIVWYCDDGSYHYGNRQIVLCTDGHSKQENELIITFFKEKYGIDFIYSCGRLFLNRIEAAKFVNLIKDLMPPSMSYKLGSDQEKINAARIWASNYEKNLRPNRELRKNYQKNYRIDNKKIHSDYCKDYYKLNKGIIKQQRKDYYGKNKDEIIKKARAYYKKNRVHVLLQKREKYFQKRG